MGAPRGVPGPWYKPLVNRCAVLGSPIAHSLSPVIHRRAYEVLGLTDWRYDAFHVDEAGLASFIEGCGDEWVGLSCTMPLKREILRHGRVSPTASALGSGNTFLFPRGGVPAQVENTDVAGVRDPLDALGVRPADALLIGAGATARSALFALGELGASTVEVVARDASRAHDSLDAVAALHRQTLVVRPWGVPEGPVRDVLVSTVPQGLDADLTAGLAARASVVFDLVYGHGPSPYAPSAETLGRPLLDGIDMLVGQALGQIRLMTGFACPAAPLQDAARAALVSR